MTKKEKALLAVDALEKLYPDAKCSLEYAHPYELMIAVRLSAQCTDARVNIVTEKKIKKYPTLEAFADADLEELEQAVKPCGFYKNKAKSIKETAMILLNDFVTNVAAWALAVGLVLVGGWLLLRYLHSDTEKRLAGADMAIGLILLLAGILLIASPTDMKEVFPKIWGLSLIFGGFLKIQYAFDEKTVRVENWWIMLIFAAFSLIIGILSLLNPAFLGDSRNLVIGILLVLEAVLDITVYLLLKRALKKHAGVSPAAAEASSPEPESLPAPEAAVPAETPAAAETDAAAEANNVPAGESAPPSES